MTNIQAQFTDKTTAEAARTKLIAAGVAPDHIHIWNNIAEGATFEANSDDASEGGALLGGALAGVAGLAAGAAIGSTYENHSAPDFSAAGVRLVIEGDSDKSNLEALLHESGASDVRTV